MPCWWSHRKAPPDVAVSKAKELIARFDLSAEDLGLVGKAAARPAGVAEYRDPQTGKTWTGNGKPPGWIAGAQNRDRFLINADPSAMEPATATALFEPKPSAKAARKKAAPATKAVTRQTPVKKALSRKPAEAKAPSA